MRLKKGSKVEVWSKRDVPSGSWWTAQIICGKGHNYFVSYDHCPLDKSLVERVGRKSIRPCPPELHIPTPWRPGNIVEVFHNTSWKLAEVLGVSDQDCYFVRVLGSSGNFKVHRSSLRARQIWQDHRWIVIMKESRHRHGRTATSIPLTTYQLPQSCMDTNNSEKDLLMEPTDAISKNSKKRFLPPDECSGIGKKMRVGWVRRHRQGAAGCSVDFEEKGQNLWL